MTCEDHEEHKLIRKQILNEKDTNKIDNSNKKFVPLVLVWVRYEEPGNYTHLILLPEIIINCQIWH